MNANLKPLRSEQHRPPLRCLWITRDIPYPQDAGDRIYSANLAAALARSRVEVYLAGYPAGGAAPNEPVQWLTVTGAKRSAARALFSTLPRIAALHATAAYRQLLARQLAEPWDAIVLDGYGSGWALNTCLRALRQERPPLLIYVSHNHEESLWRCMWRETRQPLRRLAMWQNYLKIRALERALVRHADLVTAITPEDARLYAQQAQPPGQSLLILTPGYQGASVPSRVITAATPRHVVLMGSFRWVIKQENLRRLAAAADTVLQRHGIVLDVIGDVPDELRAQLTAQCKAIRLHGFVADIAPLFAQARIALVPEAIGGGFKLKFLDYVFGRVPVAALTPAIAGVPKRLAQHMMQAATLPDLVQAIVTAIDRTAWLDSLQNQAFTAAHSLFDWNDRGHTLATTIAARRSNS